MVSWWPWQVVSLLVSQRLWNSAFARFCRRGNRPSCGEGLVQVGQVKPSIGLGPAPAARPGELSMAHRPLSWNTDPQTGRRCQEPVINSNCGGRWHSAGGLSETESGWQRVRSHRKCQTQTGIAFILPGVWEDGWGVCAQIRQLGYFKTLAKRLMGDRVPAGSKGRRSFICQGQGLLVKGLVWFLRCWYKSVRSRGLPQQAQEAGHQQAKHERRSIHTQSTPLRMCSFSRNQRHENNNPVPFGICQVGKGFKNVSCSRRKVTKETWQLNPMCNPAFGYRWWRN